MSGGGDVFINDEDLYGDDGLDADIYGGAAPYVPANPATQTHSPHHAPLPTARCWFVCIITNMEDDVVGEMFDQQEAGGGLQADQGLYNQPKKIGHCSIDNSIFFLSEQDSGYTVVTGQTSVV